MKLSYYKLLRKYNGISPCRSTGQAEKLRLRNDKIQNEFPLREHSLCELPA